MSDLVTLADGQPVTTTLAIAQGTDNSHVSVILLVRKYQADLEKFGWVRFEIEPFDTPGGVWHRQVANLNEPQATLLMTYMRNSDIVRMFKKRLVRAFCARAERVRDHSGAHPLSPAASSHPGATHEPQ